MKNAREEFIEMVAEVNRMNGLDELSSKLIGTLFIEPKEVSLEELAEMTGYSLSAVSTSLKFIERTGLVKRIKKPKSRKVFYYMEKGLLDSFAEMMGEKFEKIMHKVRENTPEIIEKYKKEKTKSKKTKKELEIIERYYDEIAEMEKILKKFVGEIKEAIERIDKKRK